MSKIAVNGSMREAINIIANNIQGSTTMFKDAETNTLSTEIPTNKMFEITNIFREQDVKTGREKRRERRKQQRKL